jgi:hypothetical protein
MKKKLIIVVAVIALSGCAGLTQMQDTVTKFDQGAHSVSTAQMSLFHQVQAAECNRNFYEKAFNFAQGEKQWKKWNKDKGNKGEEFPFDLIEPCTNKELTDDQLSIRQKLMDTITLYADAIKALANGTDDTDLSTNSKSVASNIQTLATQQKFTAITSTDTAALNTAVVTITNLILDHKKYKEIKEAASAVQQELTTIVAELKNENISDIKGLQSKKETFSNEYRTAVLASRKKRDVASFLDIVDAHNNISLIFPSPPNADQLNKTLDALVAANQALANAENGGEIPEISDFISRAQQAVTLFNSSK